QRAEIPRELDKVVLRALAKDPADRYESAEEMDADLTRVASGARVSPATEEAATAIISRPPPTPVTAITPPRARDTVPYAPPAAPSRGLAVDRRAAVRPRGDRRRLLPLQPGANAAVQLEGRRRRLPRSARDRRGQKDPRQGPARPGRPAVQRDDAGDVRLQAGPAAGGEDREGQLRPDLLVGGGAEDRRAERRRRAARPGVVRPPCGEPEVEDPARRQQRATGPGLCAESESGRTRRPGLERDAEGLERTEAGDCPECRRLDLRERQLGAARGRLRGSAQGRRQRRAEGHGRGAEPLRRHVRTAPHPPDAS